MDFIMADVTDIPAVRLEDGVTLIFAVRDKSGAYKGCLEVSQDVTAIRSLHGQKRLLDWE